VVPFALGGVVAAYAGGVLVLVLLGRRSAARAVAGFVPDCAVMFRRLVARPDATRWERWLLLAVVVYLLSPLDLVPDFIPVAGQLDDAVIVALVLSMVLRRHGEDAIRSAWPGPAGSLRIVLRAAGAPPGGPRAAATL
jgi:uncharacterized membrane protein YkvA (DUF1232 family)